jgi:drug/metabolite transporter (DMT)-like permease
VLFSCASAWRSFPRPVDKLSVVLVILFAAIFLGESLTPLKLLGGALIAVMSAGAGICITSRTIFHFGNLWCLPD